MAVIHIVDDGTAGIGELASSLREAGHVVVVAADGDELQKLAVTDPLTGLPNMRRMMEIGTQELLRAQRSAGLLCVLMVDIDHFQALNDERGHSAGDAVIQAVSGTCAQTVRAIDTVGRLHGGGFAVVAPMTDCRGAVELADRLRDRVEARSVPWEGGELRTTVSVGVAQGTPKTRSFDALLIAAEKALRRAKDSGRNRVAATIYTAPDESGPAA